MRSNTLILVPLTVMCLLTLTTIVGGEYSPPTESAATYTGEFENVQYQIGYKLRWDQYVYIGMIAAGVGIAAAAGLKVFGTGLSSISIEIIFKTAMFLALWTILSGLTYGYWADIPLSLGWFVYSMLTLMYLIGMIGSIRGGGGGD